MDTRAEPRAAAPLGLESWGPGGTGGCLCYLEKCCGNVGGDTLIRLGCVLLLFSLPPPQPRAPREWTGPREGLSEHDQRGLHKAQRSHSSFAGSGLVVGAGGRGAGRL